jgi:hypothetical protein
MKKIAFILSIIFSCFIGLMPDHAQAQGTGDEVLFIEMQEADALIILDISGSMRDVPAGTYMYIPDGTMSGCGTQDNPCISYTDSTHKVPNNVPFYATPGDGHSQLVHINSSSSRQLIDTITSTTCTPGRVSLSIIYKDTDIDNWIPKWSNRGCSGPFYKAQQTINGVDYKTNCRRIAIAKRAIFKLLDANGDGKLYNYDTQHLSKSENADYNSLCLRTGLMRFFQCQDTSAECTNDVTSSYNTPCNTLRISISKDGQNYCNLFSAAPNMSNTNLTYSDTSKGDKKTTPMTYECSQGYTSAPNSCAGGTALAASLKEAQRYFASLGDSRKKSVILITDGYDTISCCKTPTPDGQACLDTLTIQYKRNRSSVAAAKAFHDAGYTLFVVGFGGDLGGIFRNTLNWMGYYGNPVPALPNPTYTPGATPCADDPNSLLPLPNNNNCYWFSDVSTNYPNLTKKCDPNTQWTSGDLCYCFASSNDPANTPLSGYAYIAENETQLRSTLRSITQTIKQGHYAFTAPTVPTVRMVDNDTLYISSLSPASGSAFWSGTLLGYELQSNGTLEVNVDKTPSNDPIWIASIPASRTIKTYNGNFDKSNSNLTYTELQVEQNQRDGLIDYIQNQKCPGTNNVCLGDIFHSNPVVVGTPSPYFVDKSDTPGSLASYQDFYNTWKTRTKLIIVGANDGMLHAFHAYTKETESESSEVWAFIPKSVLGNLKYLDSNLDPNYTQHQYYVDSTPKVADVWIDKNGDGTKTADEWRTYLVCGLRKGGQKYFALDITDTSSPPVYKWEFPKTAAILNQVGQSWSEPAIGRVKIEQGGKLVEKWVAFIGGGFDYANEFGKTFFIIDIETGGDNFFKQFSGLTGMDFSFAAPPTAVDTDLDGFVDKVYIGDLGGQMWVFDVSFNEITKKSNSLWAGKRLSVTDNPNPINHPIYYQPAVAFDMNRTPWVYFGTGDRENPNETIINESMNPKFDQKFFAVKDDGTDPYPRYESNLKDVTSTNTFTPPTGTQKGWYIVLADNEKVLAKPYVFNQLLYFTTYTYPKTGDPYIPCSPTAVGAAKLYAVETFSGGGALDTDAYLEGNPSGRSEEIGIGAPSAPVISVGIKGEASLTVRTTNDQILSQTVLSPREKQLLYWRKVAP